MIFIDTNYFLRFFIGQSQNQHETAKDIFRRAATGEIEISTSLIVFFEIYWVASSFYKLEKKKVITFLKNILKMEFIDLENRDVLVEAVSFCESSSFDLEDAYNLSYARHTQAEDFLTFDAKLKKKWSTSSFSPRSK